MRNWFRRRQTARVAIADAEWQAARTDIDLLAGLSDDALERLRGHVERCLYQKRFTGAAGLELDDDDRLRLAILVCLPITELGYDWLRGWNEVIVYPGQFRVSREDHDEESGVVVESNDWLAGEAWQHGPLILSLDDIQEDLRDPFSGNNLVAHEVAHKLDMLDGHVDGLPPLPDAGRRQRWVRVFQREFEAFRATVDAGEDTLLDPYAAEAPDEFFAVLSEVYLSDPAWLADAYPDLHAELKAFYGFELTRASV